MLFSALSLSLISQSLFKNCFIFFVNRELQKLASENCKNSLARIQKLAGENSNYKNWTLSEISTMLIYS